MKHELTPRRKERRIRAIWTSLVLTTALFTTSAFAADSDPLTIVNNLSDFIFSCIKAIGPGKHPATLFYYSIDLMQGYILQNTFSLKCLRVG